MYTLLAQLEFQYPLRLCWLALLLPVLFFALRSTVSSPMWQRVAIVLCRVFVIVLLVVASANLFQRGTSEQRFVIFATDTSRSVDGPGKDAADEFIRAALQHQTNHVAAFLNFADKPSDVRFDLEAKPDDLDALGSDPAAALQLAAASIPGDFVPQVVLLTDGRQTAGDLGQAATAAGLPISVVPLQAFASPEVAISQLKGPIQAEPGSTVSLEVTVGANCETRGTLELRNESQVLASSEIELQEGENQLQFDVPFDSARQMTISALLSAADDTHPENNTRRIRVGPTSPQRVLLVDSDAQGAANFQQVLVQQGIASTLQSLQDFQASNQSLDDYDLLILSDIVPTTLPTDKLETIDRYVGQRGGGLILLGGDETFGIANFRDTALERMAPVTAADVIEAKKSVLAMVLVIDRSESMKFDRRMELAKVAAKQSVQVLEPHDKAGVIAFSDEVQWIAEIAPCSNKGELLRKIDTLQYSGMTRMYPAVERAVLALEQTVADQRHIILLTDGIPWPGNYRKIAREMAESGITLSTVSISPGAEQDLLLEMARIAGGRHHHCDDAEDVPAILVQETQAAAGQQAVEEFKPFALRSLPGLETESAPQLQGYARTNPKDQAEPLLFAVAGHPLLCWWRYGEGTTVAFTADVKDRWSARWQTWPGYGPFWKRLVRHAARRAADSGLDVTVERVGQQATVLVDTPLDDDGTRVEAARLSGTASSPNGQNHELEFTLVAPGRYGAAFPTDGDDEFVIDVIGQEQSGQTWQVQRTLFIDCPDELRLGATDESLLQSVAAVSGGVYDPEPASVFAADGRSVERITTYWQYFVLAAMLLFVVDVALRRLRF